MFEGWFDIRGDGWLLPCVQLLHRVYGGPANKNFNEMGVRLGEFHIYAEQRIRRVPSRHR